MNNLVEDLIVEFVRLGGKAGLPIWITLGSILAVALLSVLIRRIEIQNEGPQETVDEHGPPTKSTQEFGDPDRPGSLDGGGG